MENKIATQRALHDKVASQRPEIKARLGIAPNDMMHTKELYTYSDAKAPFVAQKQSLYLETFPPICLERFIPEENKWTTTIFQDIPYGIPLSKYILNKLDNPNWYIAEYKEAVDEFDKAYKELRSDKLLTDVYLRSFKGNVIFQNASEDNPNERSILDYAGYSNGKDICFYTKNDHIKKTLQHELTHNSDKSFSSSNAFKFTVALMNSPNNTNISNVRENAHIISVAAYDKEQFFSEYLARLLENSELIISDEDPLIKSTAKLFTLYNKLQNSERDTSHLDLALKQNLPNYDNFDEAYINLMFYNAALRSRDDAEIDECQNNYIKSLNQLSPNGVYDKELVEKILIDSIEETIEKEEEYQKKLSTIPSIQDLKPSLDLIVTYGVDYNLPLEVLISTEYNRAVEEFYTSPKTDTELLDEIKIDEIEKKYLKYQKDILNRDINKDNLKELIFLATKATYCSQEFNKRNYNVEAREIGINECIPSTHGIGYKLKYNNYVSKANRENLSDQLDLSNRTNNVFLFNQDLTGKKLILPQDKIFSADSCKISGILDASTTKANVFFNNSDLSNVENIVLSSNSNIEIKGGNLPQAFDFSQCDDIPKIKIDNKPWYKKITWKACDKSNLEYIIVKDEKQAKDILKKHPKIFNKKQVIQKEDYDKLKEKKHTSTNIQTASLSKRIENLKNNINKNSNKPIDVSKLTIQPKKQEASKIVNEKASLIIRAKQAQNTQYS